MIERVVRRALALPRKVPSYVRATRRLRSSSIAIVAYHGLVREPPSVFNWCQLSVDEFEKQIEFLSREYVVLPLDEIVDRLTRRAPLPRATACVTFDDGFRSVHTLASPILKRYQLPATVFLVTSLVGTDQPAWPDEIFEMFVTTSQNWINFGGTRWSLATPADRARTYVAVVEQLKVMDVVEKDKHVPKLTDQLGSKPVAPNSPLATLNWSEIEEMARGGLFQFGSHTHTHQILSRCSPERQTDELRISRDVLRERFGKADLFAYPNGRREDFAELTKKVLRETGYRCALSTIPGLQPAKGDLFEIRRVNVGADTSFDQFELRMVGL
jgi:peptidoglycan/xylan/chitin deacetylase (PgdA/CDA1 family)